MITSGTGAGVTLIESCAVADWGVAAESATRTVKVLVPEAVGVPLITPLEEFSVRPPGSEPTEILHE